MDIHKLKKSLYGIQNWKDKYPDYNVDLNKLQIHNTYKPFFELPNIKEDLDSISEYLSHCLKSTNGNVNLFPYPDLVFNALNVTPLDKIKVVILGQDPYHSFENYNGKVIPQAMGLSFSVPKEFDIPSSLKNIYKNMQKYHHIDKSPNHGNLSFWSYQGCLLLNTSLTVQEGCPNCHQNYWKQITNGLIKYISDNTENVIFVLWGGPAYSKIDLIDQKKHKVIISSHPSGLSYNKKLRDYESFENTDHFGEINKYLKEHNKSTILWQII
ncbi:uracil-DNA glycosylase family 1 [Fadolivirus algeromassiliense]|jgi:uracil-DNA glycosylase|uniref:Uracil-DNA glycosylase family 1 n=1 Tax=Fadolivirus FV1/VV64 TaxID=3070911 RepID=A0A7D3R1U1_9VIRU|nr:uracil-DNA glycosylase family 1 [Fadolivirus algeromassiliense]QKF94058.1 uracil-DNA glycosylase family 1 [Fadolivirus FV1/VV64]